MYMYMYLDGLSDDGRLVDRVAVFECHFLRDVRSDHLQAVGISRLGNV